MKQRRRTKGVFEDIQFVLIDGRLIVKYCLILKDIKLPQWATAYCKEISDHWQEDTFS